MVFVIVELKLSVVECGNNGFNASKTSYPYRRCGVWYSYKAFLTTTMLGGNLLVRIMLNVFNF